jgi:DNA/RNA endonuclease YhcR with UshA esterase domain
MIDTRPPRPAPPFDHVKQETTMLKTISAALIAASMLAAPAMATTVIKTGHGVITKKVVIKPSVANAQARFVKNMHHHRHHAHKHVVVVKKKF